MPAAEETFEKKLEKHLNSTLKKSTSNSYISGIKNLSKHSGIDILNINNISILESIVKQCRGGEYDEIDKRYGERAGSCGIKKMIELLDELRMDDNLLTTIELPSGNSIQILVNLSGMILFTKQKGNIVIYINHVWFS